MKSITGNYKECIISFEKVMEDGLQKKVKETYVVNAMSFTEAEANIINEMSAYISGEFDVININPAAYGEIFVDDKDGGDKWYKCKIQFITIDEKTEKEKRTNVTYLVQANDLDGANYNLRLAMKGTMEDFIIVKIEETKIMDVFVGK